MSLKYTPFQSYIESSFFTKLSELKLNQFKLDSSSRPIKGFIANPLQLNKFNNVPTINLDFQSFEPELTNSNVANILVNGHILNVNTIEEFKSIDKIELLKQWGEAIASDLEKGSLATINDFHILSYSDLKKYKFYYWVATPTLNCPWQVKSRNPFSEEINLKAFFEANKFQQFLLYKDGVLSTSLDSQTFVFVDGSLAQEPSIQLKNYLYLLALQGLIQINVIVYRSDNKSYQLDLELGPGFKESSKITGWERTSQGKLAPKVADLGSLIDPLQLAEQAVDLNLKLMKWRIMPELDLDIVLKQRALLLGAGTLGSYVARCLMGWGVKDITFVDNGRISYSNPVRQPLYTFKDCFGDNGQGEFKATRAAEAMKEIFPGVNTKGYSFEVPMVGHTVTEEEKDRGNFELLSKLFDEHDVIFLLMDSRESRWLPTLLGYAKNKIVINAALGFDSYLVMRHGTLEKSQEHPGTEYDRLGCYYCNDVVAPNDSLSDRSLDQMCTVTRPGGALMASSLAVELLVSILQHPDKQLAPSLGNSKFGDVPHQIRGFLHNFQQTKLYAPNYKHCSACSEAVIDKYIEDGWEFVKRCLNDSKYLEDVSGLTKVQQEAEEASERMLRELELGDEEDAEWGF